MLLQSEPKTNNACSFIYDIKKIEFCTLISDAAPCLHICLTWKVLGNRLVLICKVNAWNLPITFFNPLKNETGFCTPHIPKCHTLDPDTVISKNTTSQEIVLTVPLDRPHNGWWTCKYGANNEIALTEVTLNNNSLNDKTHDKGKRNFIKEYQCNH